MAKSIGKEYVEERGKEILEEAILTAEDIETPFLSTKVGQELSEIYPCQPPGPIFDFLLKLTEISRIIVKNERIPEIPLEMTLKSISD